MNFQEYQEEAHKTNLYPEHKMLECLIWGLCSESGEIAGKIKKLYRDNPNGIRPDIWHSFRQEIESELGDVLWYVSETALELGFVLEQVARKNIAKLQDRAERGMINGSGDER